MRKEHLGVVVFLLSIAWSGVCYAAFDRELENLNRENSMKLLEDFNRDIETEAQTIALSSKQIEESIAAEKEFAAKVEIDKITGKPVEKKTASDPAHPIIPKENLKEALGLQMSDAGRNSPLDIRTDVGTKMVRQSNLFTKRIDAVGDTIFSYYPTIHTAKSWEGLNFKSDYKMTRLIYRNYDHNSRFDHNLSQTLRTKTSKLLWGFSHDLSASSVQTEPATDKPNRFMTQSYGVEVLYPMTVKTSLGFGYKRAARTFLSDTKASVDNQSDAYDVKINYAMSPKTRFVLGNTFRLSEPPKGTKTDTIHYWDYYVGINGRLSEKLLYRLLGTVNFAKRSLETSPMQQSYSYTTAISYLYSPKTSFNLSAQSSQVPVVTATDADPTNLVFSLDVNHKLAEKISIGAGESVRLISDDGDFPTTVVEPDYPQNSYTAFKKETQWGTHADLTYRFDRSSKLFLQYRYLDSDSNLKTNDYINHTCEISYEKKF